MSSTFDQSRTRGESAPVPGEDQLDVALETLAQAVAALRGALEALVAVRADGWKGSVGV